MRAVNVVGWLRRVDPGRRAHAEPMSLAFCLVFGAFFVHAIVELVAHAYGPGQDAPYHALCIAIVGDRSRAGSLYASLYEPLHPLEPNTFLYLLGGALAKGIGAVPAFRAVAAIAPLGLPLATLWALRRLGRSAWPSLLAFPLSFTQVYVAGFTNFCVAGPFFVVAVAETWLFLGRPSARAGAVLASIFGVVFLLHVHVWMWLGALAIGMTLWRGIAALRTPRAGLARAGGALLVAAPSLLLFGRWYASTYAVGRVHGERASGSAAIGNLYDAVWQPILLKTQFGIIDSFHVTKDKWEIVHLAAFVALLLFALAVARLERARGSIVLELCAVATFASFFVLPDAVSDQAVAIRQLDLAAWLAPALVAPVSARASRLGRFAVVALLVLFAAARVRLVDRAQARFDEEIAGLDDVAASVPVRGGRLAYATTDMSSAYFRWNPFFHVAGWVAAKRELELPVYETNRDSNRPIRYVDGPPAPVTRLVGDTDWPAHPGLWEHFDFVLAHRWRPTPAQREALARDAELVGEAGDFQMWRRRPR